jgi:broad specificity phosphatase PhoE
MADPAHAVGRAARAVEAPPLALPADLVATVVLVRHGESTYVAEGRFQGRQDPPLSQLGMRQAGLVADRLARRDERSPLPIPAGPPVAIWHSPLQRAEDTARLIADRQPRPVALRSMDGLTELAQGQWEGQPLAEVRSRWPEELAAWRRAPAQHHAPDGEPLVDACQRVRAGLVEVVGSLPRRTPAGYIYDPVPGYVRDVTAAASTLGEPIADRAVESAQAPEGVDERDASEPWALLVAHDGVFRLVLISLLGVPLERFWTLPFVLAGLSVVTLHEGVAALRAHNLSDHLVPLAAEERAAQESRGERRGAL